MGQQRTRDLGRRESCAKLKFCFLRDLFQGKEEQRRGKNPKKMSTQFTNIFNIKHRKDISKTFVYRKLLTLHKKMQ